MCRTYREQYSYRHGGRDALEVVIINLLTFHLLEGVGVQNLQQTRIPMKTIIPITMVIAAGFIGYAFWTHNVQTKRTDLGAKTVADTALAIITLPQTLSANAKIGKRSFEAKCAVCHGANAVGQDGVAPPLVHIIYEPGHHNDESFQRAVSMGVRGHHWPFGNMPPVEGLTRGDVTMITAYIRELQQANGIN